MLQITPETLQYLRTYQRQEEAKEKAKAERKAEARKHRSRLNDQARAALTATVAHVLRTGQPTKFEYEAACRHGLRQAFILNEGWRWSVADAEAAEIVAGGLLLIGAERPTYDEGQVDFAVAHRIDRHYCARCGTPIPDERKACGQAKYCSYLCSNAAVQDKARVSGERVSLAEHLARVAQKSADVVRDRSRECEVCSAPFLAKSDDGRFCSQVCAGSDRRSRPTVSCVECGASFRSRKEKNGTRAKYCSKTCSDTALRKPIEDRSCQHCEVVFTPPNGKRDQPFCSRICHGLAKMKPRPEVVCPTCKTVFSWREASRPQVYCSRSCRPGQPSRISQFGCHEVSE